MIATENPLVMVTAVSQSLKNESKATAVPRLPGDRFGVSPGREASAVSQCGLGGFPHEQLANHERVLGSPQVEQVAPSGVKWRQLASTGVNWRQLASTGAKWRMNLGRHLGSNIQQKNKLEPH
ncbi:hypothetical protein AM228_25170 [Planktothricoides sp. SR001]|nr:hypothetical protein AM228_25170 [Planktothricoides sp. SR001]